MPSQINNLVTNIDEDYPVAGIDNDTQGFRDNFDIIKTSLAFAGQEITVLQDTTVKTIGDNDFSGNLIINADLSGVTENAVALAPISNPEIATNVINFRDGSYQQVIVNIPDADITVEWGPTAASTLEAERYAKVILELSTDEPEAEYGLTFSNPDGAIKYSNNFPFNFKVTTNPKLIEISTRTGGDTIFVEYMGEYLNREDLPILLNEVVSSLAELITDVDVSNAQNGQILKYIGSTQTWTASNNISRLSELLGDVNISVTPTNGQVLKYNGTTSKWEPGTDNNNIVISSLSGLITDVSINSPQNNQVIKYNSSSNKWENASFEEKIITHIVKIVEDESGDQEVFEIDGNQIKTSAGIINSISFEIGNKYVFDLSHPSNSVGRLKFSTTPDTSVPSSITPYSAGVTEIGTAGQAGARTEILISETTPDILYIYGDELPDNIDTSGLGGSVPIQKISKNFTGVDNILTNEAALDLNRSVSAITSTVAQISTLAAGVSGQTKTIVMQQNGGNMIVTVSNAGWKATGSGTITLDTIGKSCTLQYINDKWFCVGNNGATFA
jgi:hypothetical protein